MFSGILDPLNALLTPLFRSQHLGQPRDEAVAGDDRQAAPGRRGVAQVTTITVSSCRVRSTGGLYLSDY